MKKLTTFAILLLSLVFVACSKKDAVDEKKELIGTSWTQKGGGDDYIRILFTDIQKVRLLMRADSNYYDIPGTYVYNKPNISCRFEDEEGGVDMLGKVNGNALQLSFFADGEKIEAAFTKD